MEKAIWNGKEIVAFDIAEKYEFEKAIKDGGDNTLSNCKVLCLDCHKNTATYGQH